MKRGLVSVTFRNLLPEQIISLVKNAELDCIEWGSDIHVPVGDIENAKNVAKLMAENNLETISYGSYYRVGESVNFTDVLNTALALDAPNIRVWAGSIDSEDATEEYRKKVVEDAKLISQLAQQKGVTISFEYHGQTLTNTQQSTVQLLNEINSNNTFTYWQPLSNTSYEENLQNIKELIELNKLKNIHVYHWGNDCKFPLSDGKNLWQEYVKIAKNNINAMLLEFVKENSIEQFYEDAKIAKLL